MNVADDSDEYEYARGVVEDGALTIVYKMPGRSEQHMAHDEDVTGWSDRDVARTVRAMLDLDDGFNVEVRHM